MNVLKPHVSLNVDLSDAKPTLLTDDLAGSAGRSMTRRAVRWRKCAESVTTFKHVSGTSSPVTNGPDLFLRPSRTVTVFIRKGGSE